MPLGQDAGLRQPRCSRGRRGEDSSPALLAQPTLPLLLLQQDPLHRGLSSSASSHVANPHRPLDEARDEEASAEVEEGAAAGFHQFRSPVHIITIVSTTTIAVRHPTLNLRIGERQALMLASPRCARGRRRSHL